MTIRGLGLILGLGGLLASSLPAQETLLSVQKPDQSWYYIDPTGKTRLSGPYLAADDFTDGLGRVALSNTITGFINAQGKVVFELPVPFSQTAGFSEGLAWFVQDGRMGFVNTAGQQIIPPRFLPETDRSQQASQPYLPVFFTNGMAPARAAMTVGWLKPDGTWVKSPVQKVHVDGDPLAAVFTPLMPFSEGLAAYSNGHAFGYLNAEGQTVITPAFDYARPFSEGLALVRQGLSWGYIDRQGNWVLSPQYPEARDFHAGRAVVALKDGWALIDRTGKVLTRGWKDLALAEDLNVKLTSDPLYVYQNSEGKRGLVDSDGRLLGPAEWDQVYAFVDNHALVVKDKLLGLIDRKGQVTIPAHWVDLGYEREGLIAFSQDKKWGWLNAQGKPVIPASWVWAGDFQGGYAPVFDGRAGGLVDQTGKLVVKPVYQELGNLVEGFRIMKLNGKYGFLKADGEVALPAEYDEVKDFQNGQAWVAQNGQVFRINTEGKRLDSQGWDSVALAKAGQPVLTASGGKMGFINTKGDWAIPPLWDRALGFDDGKGLVARREGNSARWYYTDNKGTPLFTDKAWTPFSLFHDERAFVVLGRDDEGLHLGLIDSQGKLLAKGFRLTLGGFSEGLAAVAFEDGTWGYVDTNGKRLFPGKTWNRTYPFREGLSTVEVDGKYGYVDKTGNFVIPARFAHAGLFSGGLAWVEEAEQQEYIDKTGKVVWSQPASRP